jgi:hypothetical protein
MPVKIGAKAKGVAKARIVIRGMTPAETPTIVSRAMRESMAEVLRRAHDDYMSGPSGPNLLGEKTGALKASLTTDESRLPFRIRGGTPLAYGPVHEYASGGARSYLRRGLRASSRFIRAAFRDSWEKALRELVG